VQLRRWSCPSAVKFLRRHPHWRHYETYERSIQWATADSDRACLCSLHVIADLTLSLTGSFPVLAELISRYEERTWRKKDFSDISMLSSPWVDLPDWDGGTGSGRALSTIMDCYGHAIARKSDVRHTYGQQYQLLTITSISAAVLIPYVCILRCDCAQYKYIPTRNAGRYTPEGTS
jgi:hypothetical protein